MQKNFRFYLILNWKDGSVRVLKRPPSALSYSEIPVKLDLSLEIPERQEISLKGKVILDQTQISEIVLDTL